MRILELKEGFVRTRRVHAPHSSPADKAVRGVLIQLASERSTLPLHCRRGAVSSRFVSAPRDAALV
jgi:hypothetical protein